MPDDTPPPSAPSAEFFLPTRNGRDDETIAAAILRETARMRQAGSFDTHALCWNPEELELLAMYAIDAKDRLSSRSAEDRSDTVRVGDVVQIDPTVDGHFAGCLLTVTEVKSWGVQGFVKVPASGEAYYRCPFGQIARVGRAEWVPDADAARTASPRESHE
jgi:hypothetical protein